MTFILESHSETLTQIKTMCINTPAPHLFTLTFAISGFVSAATIIGPFNDGHDLDNHDIGSSSLFTDGAITSTLTTRSLTEMDGTSHTTAGSGVLLNTVSGSIGINSSGSSDSSSRFDNQEAWTFDWSTDSEFTFIDLAFFTSSATETFQLQSDDWKGLTLTPGSASVSFNSSSGTFTLSDKGNLDEFNLNDLSGGVTLAVAAGTDITISYSNDGSNSSNTNASFTEMQFNLIPEPSVLSLLGLFTLTSAFHRQRKS